MPTGRPRILTVVQCSLFGMGLPSQIFDGAGTAYVAASTFYDQPDFTESCPLLTFYIRSLFPYFI